jgi:hypothetical protein
MRAGRCRVDGHELDAKTAKRIPKSMIERLLSQQEAASLLAKLA